MSLFSDSLASIRGFRSPFQTLLFRFLIACFLAVSAGSVQSETLRVIQGSHPLDEYAIGALRVALEQLEEDIEVQVSEEQVTQTRIIEKIKENELEVMWLATNRDVESQLLPIRFPLLKGLLGYRLCIIHADSQSRFNRVETLEEARSLTYGQGLGWPDVEILQSNGFEVITTSKYENLFYMVDGGRFDGFPRGVLEPWVEIAAHPTLELAVDERMALVYRLPFYLFVNPDSPELAAKIHRGLDLALANGAYDEYVFNHPMIKSALEEADLKQRVIFNLENPTLPEETPVDRSEYWFDAESL